MSCFALYVESVSNSCFGSTLRGDNSTFVPLITSGIFYAANGENHIDYIDALFNCISACVVCGLASVDLSSLTGFQQALLFFLMSIGNPVSVIIVSKLSFMITK